MGLLRRLNRDERGISAVVAVIALIGIFGAATLSVDAGNLWQTRRNMITATDAATLAEAREFALTGSACANTYNTILEANAGADVYDRNCVLVPSGTRTGYVSVEGRKPVDVRFGVVLGLNDTAAFSLSAAQIAIPVSGLGLRPIGFCNQNSHVLEWEAFQQVLEAAGNDPVAIQAAWDSYNALYKGTGDDNGDGLIDHPTGSGPSNQAVPAGRSYAGYNAVHRMYFERDIDDGQCGDFAGNWGWLSFDGLPSNVPDRREWIEFGYDGPVSINVGTDPCPGSPGSGDADDTAMGCIPTDSGTIGNQVDDELMAILDEPIAIVVIDAGNCQGGGTTCTLEAYAFLGVILRGYKNKGAGPEYFDFEFVNIQLEGECCLVSGDDGADLGARVVWICAVDHDSQDIASRCGAS